MIKKKQAEEKAKKEAEKNKVETDGPTIEEIDDEEAKKIELQELARK